MSVYFRSVYLKFHSLSSRRASRRFALLTLAFAMTIAACNASTPSEAVEQEGIFDEPSVCSTSALTGACRGPWEYHPYTTPCYISKTDPLCTNKIPGQCHPECQHAELGPSITQTNHIFCLGAGCTGSGSTPSAVCARQTSGFLNQTQGNLTNVTSSQTVTNILPQGRGEYTADCNMTLQNVAIGVNDACLPTHDCLLDGECRLQPHGDAPPGQCGSDGALWSATATGLSLAQLSAEQKDGSPDCATLEDRPVASARLNTTMLRSNASDMFWSTLPATDAQEIAARHDLVKQAKLMYELGITSPNVNGETLRALYASQPNDELGCGVSGIVSVPDGCRPWGIILGLNSLGLCQRMLSTHIDATVFQTELAPCLDLLSHLAPLPSAGSCGVAYRSLVTTLEEKLLSKAFMSIQKASAAGPINGLGVALASIDRWYAAAARTLAADPAGLSDATGRVLTAFWARVYEVGSPAPAFAIGEAGTVTAQGQLADLFSARIEADRQVLAAAFANPPPLDEAPLLLVLGDAFSAMRERLVTAAPLYDLACRLKGSCSIAEANEATRLLRLIGAIGDDAAIGQALTAATSGSGGSGVVRAPWVDIFTALRAQRGALETAWRKVTGRSDATLAELYSPSAVGPAAEFAEQVSGSFAMWKSYEGHGVLLPSDDNMLRTSLTNANVTAALGTFHERFATLREDRIDYQRTRGDFAQTIVSRIANKQFQDRTNDEASVLRAEYDNLGRDLDGLMASQDQAEQLNGRFMETYVERASAPGWLPPYPVAGHPGSLSIDATTAQGTGTPASDVTAVAVRDPSKSDGTPWHIDVGKGDMLTFDVSGLWSPTCSLRKTTLVGPSGTDGFSDQAQVQIGPEGFSISWENDHFEAHEHVSSDFTTTTERTSVCGSIGGDLLPLTAGTIPIDKVSVSASKCREWQTGHSDTDSNSSGSRSQYAANFAGGLRVPGTPFPSLPAGSLLLVETVLDPAGGTRIRDAHVVRAHSSYTFPEAASVYLVTNDEHDEVGCRAVNTSPLAVTYVHSQSSGPTSGALAETMATILATLETSKTTYIAQGSVTATELTGLQSAAYDQLRTSCQCNLSGFEEVRGMFDAWLNAELASIERQTRIVAAERSLDSLVLRLNALQDDLAGAESSSRMLALLTYWQLGNLAYHLEDPQPTLRTDAQFLLQSANDMLALMHILYPQALTSLRQSFGSFSSLRTFDWTLPYDEQVIALENIADPMHTQIETVRNAGGGLSIAPVVVVFPKPGLTGSNVPNVQGSVTAAPSRVSGVWEPCPSPGVGFCLKRQPIFTITPEDVYGRALVGLGCQEAAPVVQSFALVTINNGGSNNDNWNTNPRRADIARAADMLFPTETGILDYRTDGVFGVLAPSRVRVLATTDAAVGTKFDEFVRRGGGDLHGVSPFGSFKVDLGPEVTTASPLTLSTAIVVYFDLQTRTATGPLAGVGTCTQVLDPPTVTPPAPPAESALLRSGHDGAIAACSSTSSFLGARTSPLATCVPQGAVL